jgi:hypothetical protein
LLPSQLTFSGSGAAVEKSRRAAADKGAGAEEASGERNMI